jgi:hypothetical protein
MNFFRFILNTLTTALSFSRLHAYNRELVAGNTKNRIWLFLGNVFVTSVALAPLMLVFPTFAWGSAWYALIALSAVIHYTASIAHHNAIAINQKNTITSLLYDLHKNEYLMQIALFLSQHFANFLALTYFGGLIACMIWGSSLYAYLSLATLSMEYLNQNNYLPKLGKSIYFYTMLLLVLVSFFGVSSPLAVGISVGMVLWTVTDYLRCFVYNVDSPTVQFTMNDKKYAITITPIDENDVQTEHKLNELIQDHIKYTREYTQPRVTFDHFYASHRIVNRLLKNTPVGNFQYSCRVKQNRFALLNT